MSFFGLAGKSALERKANEQLDALTVAAQETAAAMSSLTQKIVNGGIVKHEVGMCKSSAAWRACPFGGLEISSDNGSNVAGPVAPTSTGEGKMG